MGSRHGHTTSAITRGEPRLARGERIPAVLAALGALLPLVVMPATVLIYQPLFRQACTDTPDVHEKLAAVD